MNKIETARLKKITEAGTLRVTRLNAADHTLEAAGMISIESEPTSRGGFAYFLAPIAAEPETAVQPVVGLAKPLPYEATAQHTRAELDRAARRKGYTPPSWRSKYKGSKVKRQLSHA